MWVVGASSGKWAGFSEQRSCHQVEMESRIVFRGMRYVDHESIRLQADTYLLSMQRASVGESSFL